MSAPLPQPDVAGLMKLALSPKTSPCVCPVGACASWESMPDDRWPASQMKAVATLRDAPCEEPVEPTFEEYHLGGTRYDSPAAPVAPRYFPFNRCDVFACQICSRVLLKYTEFGGYYVDHRVRSLQAECIVDVPLPGG
ncbi:MAG: hypothetical protein KAY21_00800 [Limnohabitans sp.]|nr:hypothetical protein [Limnohabitans sp.]